MSSTRIHLGDDGSAGLLGEGRLPKYAPRIECLGSLDESSAALGLARALCKDARSEEMLLGVQRDIYTMMAEVAATPENAYQFQRLSPERLQWLEVQIEAISGMAPAPAEFILPGDSLPGAALALARTTVRRAERWMAKLLDSGEIENRLLLQYLNRLSSLCFALEVFENAQSGKKSTLAKEK